MQAQEELWESDRSNTDSITESNSTSDSEEPNRPSEAVRGPTEHSLVIFDWDDTLFCTQYFQMLQVDFKAVFSEKKSIEDSGAYLMYELQSLEEKLVSLFSELLDKDYKLLIVTNADEKWIQSCLNHFLPEFYEFIQDNEIKFYSAKKMYGKSCPVEKWKTKCFRQVILENFPERSSILKVLAIGDSTEEKLAALALKGLNYYHQIHVRFLETRKFPDIHTLGLQFQYIANHINEIVQTKNQFYFKVNLKSAST